MTQLCYTSYKYGKYQSNQDVKVYKSSHLLPGERYRTETNIMRKMVCISVSPAGTSKHSIGTVCSDTTQTSIQSALPRPTTQRRLQASSTGPTQFAEFEGNQSFQEFAELFQTRRPIKRERERKTALLQLCADNLEKVADPARLYGICR